MELKVASKLIKQKNNFEQKNLILKLGLSHLSSTFDNFKPKSHQDTIKNLTTTFHHTL